MVYKWGCEVVNLSINKNLMILLLLPIKPCSRSHWYLSPLGLRCFPNTNNECDIIWQNPLPSSTKFCRPIKFMYKKETAESTKEEVKDIEELVNNLCNKDVLYNDQIVQVKHSYFQW